MACCRFNYFAALLLFTFSSQFVSGQGTQADYASAASYASDYSGKLIMANLEPSWIDQGELFWYRKQTGQGTYRFLQVQSATGAHQQCFDHTKLAKRLSSALDNPKINPEALPISNLSIHVDENTLSFNAFKRRWSYNTRENHLIQEGDANASNTRSREQPQPPQNTGYEPARPISPNGQWQAFVQDHNLFLRRLSDKKIFQLTNDGRAEDSYRPKFCWSPDSASLVCIRTIPGQKRPVSMVDSSPDDQLQPKLLTIDYLKPGDKMAVSKPMLFDIAEQRLVPSDHSVASNPYFVGAVRWRPDSSAFTYEYNQRGHQAYRVIEVKSQSGDTRLLIDEQSDTFIPWNTRIDLSYLDDTNELIWMSERSGWNHLYLIDWHTGEVKNPITQGQWLVREVIRVDQEKRQIWFWAGGIIEGQDPYHRHLCRVNLDGSGLTVLTAGDGEHTDLSFSPNGKYFVATWSRVDHPQVHELRNADTGELIAELAKADITAMLESGWVIPERFVGKGRDGQTDIWGVICRPRNFDPQKTYPVIEYIYAGPHDHHVPKSFYTMLRMQRTAEIGFILVMIDGMGTANRSKAFHDVCWKNIKDAGFPDRIAWIKAAAQARPWMNIDRVGIYGGSAGGQNAMRAVLDHADFYDAAAADCGCHDNRMDKLWWNEQWMGWPVDESYAKSSNVVDAHKLDGALLLTVGELDKNVDPVPTTIGSFSLLVTWRRRYLQLAQTCSGN